MFMDQRRREQAHFAFRGAFYLILLFIDEKQGGFYLEEKSEEEKKRYLLFAFCAGKAMAHSNRLPPNLLLVFFVTLLTILISADQQRGASQSDRWEGDPAGT
ncbi:MAG: hypothetical protein A2078_08565 [Nitrospirae bacterium GWC2_57_9]|nr:MAG: hypothetical protein A2078_08565 [Nitrospirae bacterium GWC2_57_9]